MRASPLVVTRQTEPARDVVDAISEGLNHYNAGFFPGGWAEGCFIGRDQIGAVAAGLKFVTALEWLFVEGLWVAEPWRKQREGSRLLGEAEARARPHWRLSRYLQLPGAEALRETRLSRIRPHPRLSQGPCADLVHETVLIA
jgi:GNAT superfamily N-acetyltransferase